MYYSTHTLVQTDTFRAQLHVRTKAEGARSRPTLTNYINHVSLHVQCHQSYLVRRSARMVILLALHAGGWGSIRGILQTSGCVSVNHRPRCKNGISKCGEDRIMCASPAWMFGGDTVPIHLKMMVHTKVG